MKSDPIEKQLHINPSHLNAYSSGLLQGKAYQRMYTYLTNALLPFAVSVPEWKLLGQLYEHDKVRLAELAELLSYDPPMVTKLAKQLEKKELLLRTMDKTDERAKIIVITGKGRKLISEAEPAVKLAMANILKGVTMHELRTYIKVLSVIVNNTSE